MTDPPDPVSLTSPPGPAHVAGATDRGRARARNEDSHRVDATLGILVVADGMGGHPAGDLASTTAAEEVARALSEPGSREPLGRRMLRAVLRGDARVRDVAAADPSRLGMGTTVTALVASPGGDRVVIGHVGDSRAYVFAQDGLRQLTRDHTWVEQHVAAGKLTREQARHHRWAHVLTQAVGVGEAIEPDVLELDAARGDVYLLCTDGLTNMLTDPAIERRLEDTLPLGLDAAASALVEAANDRGGIDNITVALIRIA